MPEIKARFKIVGPSKVFVDIDILDPSITGYPKNEVKDVNTSPYFPGNPYLEPGVADHWGHACYGSMSFFVTMKDDTTRIISPIFYHDKSTSHFGGLTHWNTEFWRYTQGQAPKRVKRIPNYDVHQLEKTSWLEITASGSDFPTYKTRLEWQ